MSMRFKRSLQKQRGQASILFALMVPGLFGVFALATDGARALQTSARLNDASEMAVLAIAGLNDDNLGSGGVKLINSWPNDIFEPIYLKLTTA